MTVGTAPGRELFILGERGGKTYFRERVRVPVDADPELLAVTIDRQARSDRKFLEELASRLRLEPQQVPELAEQAGAHLFRTADVEKALARLSEHPLVEYAGAVVNMREQGFSFLTREIVVHFSGPRAEAVAAIAQEYGYTVVRELVYAPHTWVWRWNKPATLEILDSIENIAARDDVEWAELNLYVTPELDAITPTDFLWNGLWDRQLIGVQDRIKQNPWLPEDVCKSVCESPHRSPGCESLSVDQSHLLTNEEWANAFRNHFGRITCQSAIWTSQMLTSC